MTTNTSKPGALHTVGFWLAVSMALSQAVNAVRAALDPVGFATYMGAAGGEPAWVQIYGLRAAFIALVVAVMLARRDLHALKWMALLALVMPIGDALIAHRSSAGGSIIARHAATAVFLLVAYVFLARGAARVSAAGASQ